MAIVLQCDCGKTLKVSDDYAGKKARCPGCKTILDIPAAGGGKSDNGSRIEKAGVVSGAKRRPQRDDDDEDDDRPRARKPARDDDDDEPRAKRRPAQDDDDDDRPRAAKRGRDEEVDDDDDRPKKKKKKGGSKVLLFALLGGGALVFFVVVVAALAFVPYFLGYGFFFLFGGGGLGEHTRYLPDTTQSVVSIRADKVLASDLYKAWKKEASSSSKNPMKGDSIEDMLGVREEDVERLTMAHTKDEMFTIISTTKKLEASTITSKFDKGSKLGFSIKFKETKVGKYTMYEPDTGGSGSGGMPGFAGFAFVLPNSNLYVSGPPKGLKSLLERDGKPSLSEDLKNAMSMTDFSKCYAVASEIRDSKAIGSVTTIHTDAEYEAEERDISSEISVRFTVAYRDSKIAESRESEMKDHMKRMRDNFKGGTTDVSRSGSKVTGTLKLSSSEAKQHLDEIFKTFGGL